MAASLTTRVGFPNAVWKSKPAHPSPMFTGSAATCPPRTGAGIPTETTSHSQPSASPCAASTICTAVMSGPDGVRRRSPSPSSSTLTFDPPTSTQSTRAMP